MKQMKNKKIIILVASLVLLIASVIGTILIINGSKKKIDPVNNEYVTISFYTGGGEKIEPKKVLKGDPIGTLEKAKSGNLIFVGWFKDTSYSIQVFETDIAEEDMTLYASFIAQNSNESVSAQTEAYLQDCASNYSFSIISNEVIDENNLTEYVEISSAIGKIPSGFNVTKNGNEYLISPKENYDEGCQYDFTALKNVTFKGQKESVKNYKIRIHKDEVENAVVTDSMKYISFDDVIRIGDSNSFLMDNDLIDSKNIKVGDTIMFGDGTSEVTDDIEIVKVTKLENTTYSTIVETTPAELQDVFDSIDIYYEDQVTNQILEQIDKEKLANEIMNGEAIDKITEKAAIMLLSSPTFRNSYIKPLASSESGADYFMSRASIKDTAETLSFELKDGMTIEITIGDATNENFENPDENYWGALKFSFVYEGEVGDYLKVKCQFDFTQYLNVSAQGYHEGSGLDLKFDYAINCYSQTELSFKALMCSTSPDDEEEENEDDYIDITEEIGGLLGEDGEDDEEEEETADTLLDELLKYMDDEGDYIRLLEVPFFIIEHPLPEILPIFQVNLTLNFVFDIKFGAAISTKFVCLDAEQIGFTNTDDNTIVKTYHNNLAGNDRYGLTIEVCGYIGFKAGIEGQFSLSFAGLKELGEVGMGLAFGAYADFYGYARYDLAKITTTTSSTLTGGVYIEIGVYIELNVFVKSNVFQARASATIVEEKIPLVKVGNQYLLISIEPYESKVLMKESTLLASDIIKPKGKFVDLKTGKIEEREIEWNEFLVGSSVNHIKGIYENDVFDRLEEKYVPMEVNYSIFNLYLTYKGSGLSFFTNKGDINKIQIYRIYNDEISNLDILGNEYTVSYYLSIDNKEKTLITTRTVNAGNYANTCYSSIDELLLNTHTIEWDKNPTWTIVDGDMSFTCYLYSPKVLTMFVYYDGSINKWVGEYRFYSIYDKPEYFEPVSSNDISFKNWISESTDKNPVKINYKGKEFKFADSQEFLNKFISKYDCFYENEGYDSNSNIKVTANSIEEVYTLLELKNEYYYNNATYIYTEEYGLSEHDVTIYYKDENGIEKTKIEKVTHDESLTLKEYGVPLNMYLKGYSLERDSEIKYSINKTITVTENMTLYSEYTGKTMVVIVDVWNEESRKFKTETHTIAYGSIIDNNILPNYETGMTLKEDVLISEFICWKYYYLSGTDRGVYTLNENQVVNGDMHIYPNFVRRVNITIDPNGGELNKNNIYTEDIPLPTLIQNESYELYLHSGLVSRNDDNNYSYTLTGFINNETKEEYTLDTMYHFSEPITLTAVWEQSVIEYKVIVNGSLWTLDSGNIEEEYTVEKKDLENKITELINLYENRTYDVVTEGTSKFTFKEITVTRYESTKEVVLFFDSTSEYIDCKVTFIYDNGEENEEMTLKYNTTFTSLSTPFDYNNKELSAHFLGWDTNEDGIVDVNGGESYTVTGDVIIRALWEKEYYEYTIIFKLETETDLITLTNKTYHYNDEIVYPEIPKEYDLYYIDAWYDGKNKTNGYCRDANYTLIAKAYAYYIQYEINDVVYTEPIMKKPGETYSLIDKPEYDYYIVSDWETSDVTIVNNEFVMLEKNITFKATKTPVKFNVKYYIDNELIKTDSIGYETVNHCYIPEARINYKFTGWSSNDVILIDNEFTMPSKDIRFDGDYEYDPYSEYYNVLYYIDNELYDMAKAEYEEEITLIDCPTKDGYTFSGWLCDTDEINDNKLVKTEQLTIIYGYFTKGDVTVELWLDDGENYILYTTLYGNPGDIIELPELSITLNREWKYNDTSYFKEFIIPSDEENIELIASLVEKTYKVEIKNLGYFYGVDETIVYKKPGDKVILPSINELCDSYGTYDSLTWLKTSDVEIEYSIEKDEYSFIMPSYDVYLYTYDKAAGEDVYTIELYYNDIYNDKEFFIGEIVNSTTGVQYLDYYQFDSPYYQGGDWHYADGSTCIEISDISSGTTLKLYKEVTLPKIIKETLMVDGELYKEYAKIGNSYIFPHSLKKNVVSDIYLEKEGYQYTGFVGYVNNISMKDEERFFVNENSTLENFSYKDGNNNVIVEIYNDDILTEFPYFTYEIYLDDNEYIRIPRYYNNEKYTLSVSAEIFNIVSEGSDILSVEILEDNISNYIILPSLMDENSILYIRITLNPITE